MVYLLVSSKWGFPTPSSTRNAMSVFVISSSPIFLKCLQRYTFCGRNCNRRESFLWNLFVKNIGRKSVLCLQYSQLKHTRPEIHEFHKGVQAIGNQVFEFSQHFKRPLNGRQKAETNMQKSPYQKLIAAIWNAQRASFARSSGLYPKISASFRTSKRISPL